MFPRLLKSSIEAKFGDQKAIIMTGPRQVGKTTLLHQFSLEKNINVLWWNGDEPDIRADLEKATSTYLKKQIGKHSLLIIDEAQRIENIGIIIKLIVDNIDSVKVIATGSSSFDLSNKINEPLTGRKWEFFMYPLSVQEVTDHTSKRSENRLLEHRLIYGFYPEVVTNTGREAEILKPLSDSYLYKDILTWEQIRKPAKLEKLVQALAFQVGQQISINELSQVTGLQFHTVERYINLLEKAFIIFQVSPFSRNLRNEIKKSSKIYFYDNGIRNAVINQFNSFELRQDKGALWENFLMAERKKFLSYNGIHASAFFWRNHAQQEIDYIEEKDGTIHAYEFKWNPKAKAKFSRSFTNEYNPSVTKVITRQNYQEFVMSASE